MSSTETSNRKRRRASSTSTHREESTSSIAIRTITIGGVTVASSSGFESLVDDILDLILQFVGKRSYGSYGRINKRCHIIFLEKNLPKETYLFGYAPFDSSWFGEYARYSYYKLAKAALAYNRNDILQGLLLKKRNKELFTAAAGVSLKTLKRVKNLLGDDGFTSRGCWDLSETAARHERLDVLKWLKRNDWFSPSGINNFHMDPAARNGNMPVLEWLVENGCCLNYFVFITAVGGGHLNVLEFLKRKQCPLDPNRCMHFAVVAGRMESIHWLLQNGCSFENVHKHTINQAAAGGHLHVIKFFIENGYSINDVDEEVSYKAARSGHLNVLQWLKKNSRPFDEVTFENAARSGNIENLQWLLDNNCPWGKLCYAGAFTSNKLESLEWLKWNLCPRGDSVLPFDGISSHVGSEVRKWVRENGFRILSRSRYENSRVMSFSCENVVAV